MAIVGFEPTTSPTRVADCDRSLPRKAYTSPRRAFIFECEMASRYTDGFSVILITAVDDRECQSCFLEKSSFVFLSSFLAIQTLNRERRSVGDMAGHGETGRRRADPIHWNLQLQHKEDRGILLPSFRRVVTDAETNQRKIKCKAESRAALMSGVTHLD